MGLNHTMMETHSVSYITLKTNSCHYNTVTHAEYKAILARGTPSFKDCTLYVTKFPCHGCAQVIVQSGIKKIIYDGEEQKPKEKKAVPLSELDPKDKDEWKKQTKNNSLYASVVHILKDIDKKR